MHIATKIFTLFINSISAFLFLCIPVNADETKLARFAYFGSTDSDIHLGIQQSLHEANRQGRFLGQKYELDVFAADKLNENGLVGHIAILVNTEDSDFLVNLANNYPAHAVFNLSLSDTALRAACYNNILHVLPSNEMLDNAMQQWQKKSPDTPAVAQAWHPDFKKYAARDLNKRFLKKQKVPMNDGAWAGWAGTKMTWDGFARGEAQNSKEMLSYLKNKLIFDGQKGINMTFRKTGQLIQPVLIVADDKIVAEAPVRGVAKSIDSLGLLDCAK